MKPASKLPWRVEDWNYSMRRLPEIVPTITNGEDAIAQPLGLWRNGEDGTEERNANAAYIAHAANLYPELVEACWIVAQALGNGATISDNENSVYGDLLRDVLTRAETEEE